MSGKEIQSVDTEKESVEVPMTDGAAIAGNAVSQPPTADDIPTPAFPSGEMPEGIEEQSKDTKDSISSTPDKTSDSSGTTLMQLPDSNVDNEVGTSSMPTTTDAAAIVINGETINDANTTNDRPWDFTNRKVIIQGVDKYHDVKTATKMLHKWLDSAKTKPSSPFEIDKLKKPPKSNWLVVTLQSESMIQPFIDFINTSHFKSRKGETVFAKMPQSNHNDNDHDTNNHDPNGDRKRRHRNDDDDDGARDNENGKGDTKRQRRSIDNSTARRPISQEELYNRVIPLWNLPPTEQANHKLKEMIKKCAMKIIVEIKNKFRALEKEKSRAKVSVYPWILQQRCIDIQPIITAPTPLRNKCEMTFGYQYTFPTVTSSSNDECEATMPDESSKVAANVDVPGVAPATVVEPTKVPAVGFMVTGWAGGVSFSNALPNVPYEVSMIVDIVNKFLLDSPLEPYDCTTHTGFWRILTIRTSRRTKECMIIIQHNSPPSELNATADSETPVDCATIVANEKERLVSLLVNADLLTVPPDQDATSTLIKVTSLFFQEFSGLSNPSPEHPVLVQHAHGATYLTEQLGDCRFQISPGAFFQVNTEGAEILYQLVVDKVREVSQPDPQQTLLFDVCCGTGTIGITCLKAGVVGQVVGVDISEPAIADANRNAVLNGYTTNDISDSKAWNETRFVASRAELVLGREIQNAKQRPRSVDDNGAQPKEMKFVAVVDPAREGLHADVVKAIRANQRITRLVYVSCNPTVSLVRDAALFCSPPTKRYTGRPFRITSAQPVDMFPLTNHCEMVMTFDRLSENEM